MDSKPYVYQPYPRRLYMGGEVIAGDLHATNSVVVEDEAGEADARAKGYRKAYESIEKQSDEDSTDSGGNGGSDESAPGDRLPEDQGDAAVASAGPDDLDALRAQAKVLGLKVHHKAGADKLREAIAQAGK